MPLHNPATAQPLTPRLPGPLSEKQVHEVKGRTASRAQTSGAGLSRPPPDLGGRQGMTPEPRFTGLRARALPQEAWHRQHRNPKWLLLGCSAGMALSCQPWPQTTQHRGTQVGYGRHPVEYPAKLSVKMGSSYRVPWCTHVVSATKDLSQNKKVKGAGDGM